MEGLRSPAAGLMSDTSRGLQQLVHWILTYICHVLGIGMLGVGAFEDEGRCRSRLNKRLAEMSEELPLFDGTLEQVRTRTRTRRVLTLNV